ncbi:MAG: hypothetical protein H6553_01205 [Chitinophagales bacterium]|nr:hypothetical protein [Chitinophagales bacterium]
MKKLLNILIALTTVVLVSSCIPTAPVGGNTSPNIVYKQYNHALDYYNYTGGDPSMSNSWEKTRYYDIDNDGQNDFIIATHLQTPYYPTWGISSNASFTITRTEVYYSGKSLIGITAPQSFQINQSIDENTEWSNYYRTAEQAATSSNGEINYPSSFQIAGFSYNTMTPQGGAIINLPTQAQDQTYYLGIKIVKDNNSYYGWLRLKHEYPVFENNDILGKIGARITVLESAFNTNANEPILAGKK